MTKIFLLLSISIFMMGCASQTQLAKLEAHEWTELTCSGFLTWNDCRQQARAICPKGFYMADQFENYAVQRRVMSIACKK